MSGYVQLLACGTEKEIFNENPQMSYFRNTYYRHTNFYIANQETLNNNVKGHSTIQFVIPKEGDYLSKSYIKFDMPDNYAELFYEYANVNTTLITNILNFYDCFTIRTNTFSKTDIKEIKLVKMQINNYFTIFSSFFDSQDLMYLLFTNPVIGLSTDTSNYYYNANQPYLFYSFDYYQNPFIPVLSNPIVDYLFSVINFEAINYLRIDLIKVGGNVAIKIKFPVKSAYQTLSSIILNSVEEGDNVRFKIDKRELYFYVDFANGSKQDNAYDLIMAFSLAQRIEGHEIPIYNPPFSTANNVLYNRLRNMAQLNKTTYLTNIELEKINKLIASHAYNVTIIDNKVSSSSFHATNLDNIIQYVRADSASYLNIDICPVIPNITLYRFAEGNFFFGNYDNIDFNNSLIADETVIINNNAFSNNNNLSMNVFLKLFTTYYCLNVPPTIQNYLQFVNTNKTQSVAKYYSNNITAFNNLTIQVLFSPNILVLNYDNLQSILYQKEIKDLFSTAESTTNLIVPYINRKPFANSEIVLNRYIYDSAIQFINTTVASAFNLNGHFVNILILLNLTKEKRGGNVLYANLLYNYNINNFVFDDVDTNDELVAGESVIANENIVVLLYYFNFINIVIQSINTISNIWNLPSPYIYDVVGKNTELVFATTPTGSILPLSSNLFSWKNANEITTVFNMPQNKYLIKALDLINGQIVSTFNEYEINYNDNITLPIINSFSNAITNGFDKVISTFYDDSVVDVHAVDFDIVNSFFDAIIASGTSFNAIYNIDLLGFDLNYFVLNGQFDYVDGKLFNNAFRNNLLLPTIPVPEHYGVKFLFNVNSPLYRIYYLFTFLAFMSVDNTLINVMPFDLVTLRDLTLNFVLQILNNFGNLVYNPFVFGKYNIANFDLSLTFRETIDIANNFLCYDAINAIESAEFDENDINIYNAFFFVKNLLEIAKQNVNTRFDIPSANQINYTTWQDELYKTIYSTIKNNYDDALVSIFMATIVLNKKYFKNVESVINLVTLFLQKDNINFTAVIVEITTIVNSYNQYNNYGNLSYNPIVFNDNPLYYNNYYTTFSIGAMFDNANELMITTINSIYNISTETLNRINTNYFTNLSPSIKQYQDILTPNNSFDLFSYIKTIFYEIGFNFGFNAKFQYNNLITAFNKYLLNRITFINKYVVKRYLFEECLSILDKYVLLFNAKNKTSVDLYGFYNVELSISIKSSVFVSPRIIVIYLLYLSFLQQCFQYEVDVFVATESDSNKRFETYLLQKYTYNIYTQCLNELIAVLSPLNAESPTILLDYSTINTFASGLGYPLGFSPAPNSGVASLTPDSQISEYKTYFNKLSATNGFDEGGNTRYLVNYFNIWNQPTIAQNSIAFPFVETDIVIFQDIQHNVQSLTTQTNKLLYTIYSNNNLSIVSFSVNDVVNNSFQKTFELYKTDFYINSQTLLEDTYNALNNSFNFDLIVNPFGRRIVNYSMNILNNYFSDAGENNYYKSIFYTQYATSGLAGQLTTDLCVFTTTYLNNIISKSMRIEGGINRIIYYYLTQYAISLANPSVDFIKTHSLYDYVRMFSPLYANSANPVYETNLELCQNVQVFELLNFNNFAENISMTQNAWFNELLLLVNGDIATPYGLFYDFIVLQNVPSLNDFLLSNGTNTFEYFTISPVELDELNQLFYDFVVSNQFFSPYHIYNEIIAFKQTTYNVSAQLSMDFDGIKKKIVVYCFVMHLCYTNIPNFIRIDTLLEKRADYYLQYDFPDNPITFKISNAFLHLNADFVINISDIVTEYMQKVINNVTPSGLYPLSIQNAFNELTSISTEYVVFATNFVDSYKFYIGNENVNTTSLLANTFEQIFNTSNNAKNNNIILNNDIDQLNPDLYAVTIYCYNQMDMFYEQELYDLNNPLNNNIKINTEFADTKHILYNKTDINTMNMLYNTVITYVNYFGIVSEGTVNTTTNTDAIINYVRYFAKSSVNEVLELLKGVATNNLISLDFIDDGFNPANLNINMFSRANNIKNLSTLSILPSNDYDMSIIAPNDYDFNTNNITFYQIYNNFLQINIYKKYYNLAFNFYNFPSNYTVVYVAKYKYYQNVLGNSNAINNIKANNTTTYIKLMIDIYYTIIANSFYINLPIIESEILFVAMNACVTLYLKYNFAFRINTNITNVENLKLNAELQLTNNITTNRELELYIKKLYYYELFSANIVKFDAKTVQGDFITFMEQLAIPNNFNFTFHDWIINYVYRFQLIIGVILANIQQTYGITITIDNNQLLFIMQLFVFEIANPLLIGNFFSTIYVNYGTTISSLYKIISNFTAISHVDFISRFSQAIQTIIYYIDNFSTNYILQYTYNMLFKDITFHYYEYAGDNYKLYDYVLDFVKFREIVSDYMAYYVNNRACTGFAKFVFEQFIEQQMTTNANKRVDFENLTILLSDAYGFADMCNSHSFPQFLFNLAMKVLTNNFWGIVFISNALYFRNIYLSLQISYIDLYFASLNKSTYYLENIGKQDTKLQQLYRINILLLVAENSENRVYTTVMEEILTNAHTIVFNGLLTRTIDETNDIAIYFDYLNKNIIANNRIENYYKNVQNETIKNVLLYGIHGFGNNAIKNNFLIDIYNQISTHLITYNETNLGLLYFNNTVVAILNNYNLDQVFDNIVINNENTSYVNTIIRTVFIETFKKLSAYKNVFGENNPLINSMFINTNLVFNVFNKTQYVFNDKFITIFTFIYANYANVLSMFNYDTAVTLFYYNCLVTFLLRYGENYDMLGEIVFFLVNLINNNIIAFLEGDEIVETTTFFDGLSSLLFDKENYVVDTYAQNCYKFFNTIIHNLFWTTYSKNFLHTTLIQKDNLRAFSQTSKISVSAEYLNNKVTNSLIYNAKINTWKRMLAVITDYNQSNFIKNMKSVMYDGANIINVQQEYVDYIEGLNAGLINHYGILQIIEDVRLFFGDQIVDRITDDLYKIILDLFTNVNKLDGMNAMLGITDNIVLNGLKPYIKKMQGRVFYLPLNFFFERIMNGIPLIACIHLNPRVDLHTRSGSSIASNNTIIKDTIVTNGLSKFGDFQTSLYSNYFLVEREERKDIASKAMNNLIEKHGSYSLSKTVEFTADELVFVQFDFEMTNMVKELIWYYDFSLNNYKIAHGKQSNPTEGGQSVGESDNIYDYLVNVVFYMDGIHRDGMEILTRDDRNNAITEYINKYKYCTRASPNNIYNNYSFALKPEDFQPSGAINMSHFSVFRIELVFDKNSLETYLGKFNKITNFNSLAITMHLNTLEYNEMIYRSGLAGLGYAK